MNYGKSLTTVFELLMYAFRATGPYQKQEGILVVPMDDGVTLAYLRGLLTLQVILKTPKLTQMDLDFDVVDQA